MKFQKTAVEDAAKAHHPNTRKVHHHRLWSSGLNEEWCIDGHKKILLSIGIGVWGIIDKYARLELSLWAVPNPRQIDLPPALYLRLIRKKKGICFIFIRFCEK